MYPTDEMASLRRALANGRLIPYLGPATLELAGSAQSVPASPEALAAVLTARATVPHKIRGNLTAAAQFIENFKHRKTISKLMSETFAPSAPPSRLHLLLAELAPLPLVVTAWYDDTVQSTLAGRDDWGMVQGVSHAEHRDGWFRYYDAQGRESSADVAATWATLLYQPLGSVRPAANFLVSDSDFVEVLTEIDIQTPIPPLVQERRRERGFLFLGMRFNTQLERNFARQIMKRSGGPHFAVLHGPTTRNEARFITEQDIVRIDMPLADFTAALAGIDLAAGMAVAI